VARGSRVWRWRHADAQTRIGIVFFPARDYDERHNKPAHAVPLASARQRQKNKKKVNCPIGNY